MIHAHFAKALNRLNLLTLSLIVVCNLLSTIRALGQELDRPTSIAPYNKVELLNYFRSQVKFETRKKSHIPKVDEFWHHRMREFKILHDQTYVVPSAAAVETARHCLKSETMDFHGLSDQDTCAKEVGKSNAERLQDFVQTIILTIFGYDFSEQTLREGHGTKLIRTLINSEPEMLPLIGLSRTKLNAHLLRSLFKSGPPEHFYSRPPPVARFSFMFIENRKDWPLLSWTDGADKTIIAIQPQDLMRECKDCNEKFLRVFAHELAQSADGKADRPPWKEFKRAFYSNSKTTDVCSSYAVIGNPLIRMALSAIRAYRTEDQVLNDLGYRRLFDRYRDPKNCSEIIREQLKATVAFGEILKYEYSERLTEKLPNECSKRFDSFTIEESLEIINHAYFFNESGQRNNLCAYLAEPELVTPYNRAELSRGPRGRTSNGTGIVVNEPKQDELFETLENHNKRLVKKYSNQDGD